MKHTTCGKCRYLEEGGVCGRYGKKFSSVRCCGVASRYNRRPFSRGGAENSRKWFKEQQERENKGEQ